MKILLTLYYKMTKPVEDLLYYLSKRELDNPPRYHGNFMIRWGKFSLHRIDVLRRITLLDRDNIDNKISKLGREEGV